MCPEAGEIIQWNKLGKVDKEGIGSICNVLVQ